MRPDVFQSISRRSAFWVTVLQFFLLFSLFSGITFAQVSVTTNRYDNARTGQNTGETVLTPLNVGPNNFGRLWTYDVDGQVFAQPLYLPNVSIPGKGSHNVLYVATEHDSVYALDADSLGGEVTTPLWHRSFVDLNGGVTPGSWEDVNCDEAIFPEIGITSTPVIDSATGTIFVVAVTKENGQYFQRLHALNIATGAEKPGSPVEIKATYPGTGDGSVNGQIAFNPLTHLQRSGLLLNQGNVYITWASYCDNDPYHGWIIAYNKDTLQQSAAWMTTPNGQRGGIWMTGSGLAADGGGNIYAVVGNGTFDEGLDTPLDYGNSILKLALDGTTLKVRDYFTPYNQAWLADQDLDLGSSGGVLLPLQRGHNPYEMVTAGKEGRFYLVSRDTMGHFNPRNDAQLVQWFYLPGELFSTAVSWNGNVFTSASNDTVRAYELNRGILSTAPTSVSAQQYGWPGTSLSVSSNGTKSGILWALETAPWLPSVLHAYDATNLQSELYNSSQVPARDSIGDPVKFVVPMVANGKVYVGAAGKVAVFGLLNSITPTPDISPWGGTYSSAQTVTIADDRQDATIYYTTDGSTPTVGSPIYSGPFTIEHSAVVKAIAVAQNSLPSLVGVATFTIVPGADGGLNFGLGFQQNGLNLQGSAALSGTRLRLTDGGQGEAASAWYPTPVNIQAFTQDFLIQLSSPAADGMTFIIQNYGPNALGFSGGSLGYTPITSSVAVKFDLYDNAGEGPNSTGLYTGGASPTVPAVDLRATPIDLHSQHVLAVHMTYDGSVLKMQITDLETNKSFSTQWTVDIPGAVGSPTAYLGFGAGTGGATAVQDVLSWTFVSDPITPTPVMSPWGGTYTSPQTVTITDDRQDATVYYTTDGSQPTEQSPVYSGPFVIASSAVVKAIAVAPNAKTSSTQMSSFIIIPNGFNSINYGTGFTPTGLNLQGSAALSSGRLRLTDGGQGEAGTAWYSTKMNVQAFTQDFLIQLTNPGADGMSFIIQNAAPDAVGFSGMALGYSPIAPSVAVKFDLYDNQGEGPNSTGLYTGGALPTVPALDLSATPIDLHSGDVLAVHMTYDGATLVMQITDMQTLQNYTTQWSVDIPGAVGDTNAYLGFGGSTGGLSAVQDVLSWTFVSQGGVAKKPGPVGKATGLSSRKPTPH